MAMASQFADTTSLSNFFGVAMFVLWSLLTDWSFMSVLLPVLELRQFSFIRDWPEIRKSEIAQFEFCPISGDWGELVIPSLAQMSLMQCYQILLPFLSYEGKTNREEVKRPPTQIRVKSDLSSDVYTSHVCFLYIPHDTCT